MVEDNCLKNYSKKQKNEGLFQEEWFWVKAYTEQLKQVMWDFQ